MEETKPAVETTESAPVESKEVVNEPATTQQEKESPIQETPTQTPPQVADALDEFGVPYKNRAFEWKRKAEDLTEKLPSLLEETVQKAFQQYGQPAQQKEYTISELERYAIDNPEYRPWVEEQKATLIKKQLVGEMDAKIKATETQRQADVRKQQSLHYVMQTYPDIFAKNQQGQIVGWNQQHPLTQQIGNIMQDPRFANDPEGLMAASDIAYARYSRSQQPVIQQKEQQLKAEVKQLQKKTLVEGGSKQGVQVVPEHRALIEKAKQTGSVKDVAKALEAMTKARLAQQTKE